MPKLYVLVGVPASGKSTWVAQWAVQQEWIKDCAYISTDQYVEAHAAGLNKTYNEVFEEVMPACVRKMTDAVVLARTNQQDIIWDQTSTKIASRKKKFNMLPDYYKIAVVFPVPEDEEHKRRLASRPGKIIPQRVLIQMINGYESPTLEEGFDEIWNT
jgi:predicted kinase